MPSFTHQEALNYWHNYKDSAIYRVVTFMETLEDWTADEKDSETLNAALEDLGKTLDNIGKVELDRPELFVQILAHLKASRTLRILQCLDTAYPGAASKLISHAEESSRSVEDTPGLFLRRNVIFERLRLIPRIFSKERLALVQSILEEEDDDNN